MGQKGLSSLIVVLCIKQTNMKRIKTHKITINRHDRGPHRKEEGHNLSRASRFYIYIRRFQKLSFLSYTNPCSDGQYATTFPTDRHDDLAWFPRICLLMKELAKRQNIQDSFTTMKYIFLRLER